MMIGNVSVSMSDKTTMLKGRIASLTGKAVYVGIPAEKSVRKRGAVNNAELLFIHTNGSPIRHIPKRPVIEPAIQAHKEEIIAELRAACMASLDLIAPTPAEATRHLERAGMRGMNAARGWFRDPRNGWAPNAPATIIRKKSDRPLIDTGQMRRAITYLVREA